MTTRCGSSFTRIFYFVTSILLTLEYSEAIITKYHAAEEGRPLDLKCHLSDKKWWTKCLWQLNDEDAVLVTRNDRLNNVDNAMTLYTGFLHRLKVNAEREDCSIKIEAVDGGSDSGIWSCNLTTGSNNSDHSEEVFVQVFPTPEVYLAIKNKAEDPDTAERETTSGGGFLIDATVRPLNADNTGQVFIEVDEIEGFVERVDQNGRKFRIELNHTRGFLLNVKTNSYLKQFNYDPDWVQSLLEGDNAESRGSDSDVVVEIVVTLTIISELGDDIYSETVETDHRFLIGRPPTPDEPQSSDDKHLINANGEVPIISRSSSVLIQNQSMRGTKDVEIVYILVPFIAAVMVVIAVFLTCCAYKNGWWCFQRMQNSGYCSVSTHISKSPQDFSKIDGQANIWTTDFGKSRILSNSLPQIDECEEDRIYEEIDQESISQSTDRLYDKLDFQRPNVEHLSPHYQSTNSLHGDADESGQVPSLKLSMSPQLLEKSEIFV